MSIVKAYRKQWQTGMYAICKFKCDTCGRTGECLAYITQGNFRGPCRCGKFGLWRQIMWPVQPPPVEEPSEQV